MNVAIKKYMLKNQIFGMSDQVRPGAQLQHFIRGPKGIHIWRVKGHGLYNNFFSKLLGGNCPLHTPPQTTPLGATQNISSVEISPSHLPQLKEDLTISYKKKTKCESNLNILIVFKLFTQRSIVPGVSQGKYAGEAWSPPPKMLNFWEVLVQIITKNCFLPSSPKVLLAEVPRLCHQLP